MVHFVEVPCKRCLANSQKVGENYKTDNKRIEHKFPGVLFEKTFYHKNFSVFKANYIASGLKWKGLPDSRGSVGREVGVFKEASDYYVDFNKLREVEEVVVHVLCIHIG